MNLTLPKYQKGFRRLYVWREAHAFTICIYQITKKFPPDERFGITDQLRRASSSVGANIAEGSGRHTTKDQSAFYWRARSSLLEVDNFLELAHDLGYLEIEEYRKLLNHLNKIAFLLTRLINYQP